MPSPKESQAHNALANLQKRNLRSLKGQCQPCVAHSERRGVPRSQENAQKPQDPLRRHLLESGLIACPCTGNRTISPTKLNRRSSRISSRNKALVKNVHHFMVSGFEFRVSGSGSGHRVSRPAPYTGLHTGFNGAGGEGSRHRGAGGRRRAHTADPPRTCPPVLSRGWVWKSRD